MHRYAAAVSSKFSPCVVNASAPPRAVTDIENRRRPRHLYSPGLAAAVTRSPPMEAAAHLCQAHHTRDRQRRTRRWTQRAWVDLEEQRVKFCVEARRPRGHEKDLDPEGRGRRHVRDALKYVAPAGRLVPEELDGRADGDDRCRRTRVRDGGSFVKDSRDLAARDAIPCHAPPPLWR